MQETADEDERPRDGGFRLEEFLPFRLCVTAESMSHLIARHLAQPGLAMAEWRVLAAVGRYGVLSPTATGERTSMDKVKVSRAAGGLVARGLLKQGRDPNDGRGRLLRLTRKGATVYTGLSSIARDVEAAISPCLTKAEWSGLQKALGRLNDHIHSILAAAEAR